MDKGRPNSALGPKFAFAHVWPAQKHQNSALVPKSLTDDCVRLGSASVHDMGLAFFVVRCDKGQHPRTGLAALRKGYFPVYKYKVFTSHFILCLYCSNLPLFPFFLQFLPIILQAFPNFSKLGQAPRVVGLGVRSPKRHPLGTV